MTSAPWQCPDCSLWLAPHVDSHRCDRAEVPTERSEPGPDAAQLKYLGGTFERQVRSPVPRQPSRRSLGFGSPS